VTLNPEAKEDLFRGKINLFACASCGFEGHHPVPLLYHDMENRFMVQYYPIEALENDSFFDRFTADGKLDLEKGDESEASLSSRLFSMFLADFHLVFSMEELLRYVTFRDKLSESKREAGKGTPPLDSDWAQQSRIPQGSEASLSVDHPPAETPRMSVASEHGDFLVEMATEDDWLWLVHVMTERLWESVSPLAAQVEQQHRAVAEELGLQVDEDYVDKYLSTEAGRRFVRGTVTLQIARIRGPDGYPNHLLIASDGDGMKAGYVWVGRTRHEGTLEPEALIVDLYVVEAYRRKGLGSLLVETAERWARQQSLNEIALDFEPENTPARGLYDKLGYDMHTFRMTKRLESDEGR